ncbi:MAG: ATP-binding protein [Saprospiraceae bacterium]
MLTFLNDLVEHWLLPDRLDKDDITLHRDRVLAWVHLMAIFASVILVIASYFVSSAQVLIITVCNIGLIALAHGFKRHGSNVISGNLLVFLVFSVLMYAMMPTGGLYSDNLPWMILVPISAFLLTERKWGLVWSIISIAVIFGLYYLEVTALTSYKELTLSLQPEYFLVSFIGLFGMVIGVITIFVKGNENLLDSINSSSEKLRRRSIELESKNHLLKQQEIALKRSNQDLELLAYVASHDLKEPLRMINVYAKLLDKSLHDSMTERDQEFIKYIKEGGQRMQTMLEDLLAYGKLGRENKGEEPVDLERTLIIVKNNLKLRFQETNGTANWSQLPVLKGRSTHFIQLFQNLIANSLKFSREGVAPVIELSGEQTENGYSICLSDNGMGIPEGDIDKIFGVFQRLGVSSKLEGSGIGLATVSRIMEGLGGTIKVESEFGMGTSFILSFPTERVISTQQVSATVSR